MRDTRLVWKEGMYVMSYRSTSLVDPSSCIVRKCAVPKASIHILVSPCISIASSSASFSSENLSTIKWLSTWVSAPISPIVLHWRGCSGSRSTEVASLNCFEWTRIELTVLKGLGVYDKLSVIQIEAVSAALFTVGERTVGSGEHNSAEHNGVQHVECVCSGDKDKCVTAARAYHFVGQFACKLSELNKFELGFGFGDDVFGEGALCDGSEVLLGLVWGGTPIQGGMPQMVTAALYQVLSGTAGGMF